MSRFINFNGVVKYAPGGVTRVTADVLDSVGLASTGVIGLIGEADGGAPGTVAGLVSFRDPSRAVQTYKSGPLVDAIRLAFQSSADPLIPGGATEVVVYKVNSSTRSTVNVPNNTTAAVTDTAAAGSSTTSINLTTGGLVVGAWAGYWVDITLASLPGSPVYRRQVVSNTATVLTITPALPAAPVATNPVVIRPNWIVLTSKDYGAGTAGISTDFSSDGTTYQVLVNNAGAQEISDSLGGTLYLKVLYRGGAPAIAADTFNSTGSSNNILALTTGGLTPSTYTGYTLKIVPNPAAPDPIYVRVTTNTASTITIDTPLTTDEFASLVNGVSTITLLTVTNAVGTITGASGVATAFTTTITGVTGDNLNIPFTAGMTLNGLIKAINLNPNYVAAAGPSLNADVVLAKDFDFGTTAVNIQTSVENTTVGFKQDLREIVDWFNNVSSLVGAARATTHTVDGSHPPTGTGELYTISPTQFVLEGGTRGISSNSAWQLGFDALITRPINLVVPLIDQNMINEGYGSTATWSSVSQQLLSHINQGRGVAGLERGGVIGVIGTKNQFIAACNSLNDPDIQCVSQNPTILNATGTLYQATPRMFAVMAASMRAGTADLGEPLTHKYIRTSGITQDASWNPGDLTDEADLIIGGCLFAETIPGQGIRWVRDLTTWVHDDNLCYTEGSIRDVVRNIAYNLRTTLVNRFIGRRALPATIANIKDVATTVLENYRSQGAIVDSTDPVSGATTKAYNNLKVYASGDTVRVVVSIFPVPGINFLLNEIFLQVPSQSA